MAGRNHLLPNASRVPPYPDPRALHPHPVAQLEKRVVEQEREIQTLLVDNQRLAASHVALKQDLAAAEKELRHLAAVAVSVKKESDAQIRDFYERSLGLEAEFRSVDAHAVELAQVQADIQNLTAERKDLMAKLATIDGDLVRARSELQQYPAIKAEIEALRKEVQRGRAAIKYEKKLYDTHLEQSQIMEENMISMAREIDKLNAERMNAEKRAQAAVVAAAAATSTSNPGLAAGYMNPEPRRGGNFYPDPYAAPQIQGSIGATVLYGPRGMPYGPDVPYNIQGSNTHGQPSCQPTGSNRNSR